MNTDNYQTNNTIDQARVLLNQLTRDGAGSWSELVEIATRELTADEAQAFRDQLD
jgi:hypothetical protein